MNEADELIDRIRRIQLPPPPPKGPHVDGARGSGDDGRMEARVTELEKATADIRERLARMEAGLVHVATKNDVSSLESTLLKWFIGTAIALTGLAFAAAKLIH